jgi:hypothetical protein
MSSGVQPVSVSGLKTAPNPMLLAFLKVMYWCGYLPINWTSPDQPGLDLNSSSTYLNNSCVLNVTYIFGGGGQCHYFFL